MKPQEQSNCVINKNQVYSPLGPWNVIACDLGLHSVKLSDEVTNDNFLKLGSKQVNLREKTNNKHILDFKAWMQEYYGHTGNYKTSQNAPIVCEHIIPTNVNEINFRQKAWLKLKDNVPYGKTISYGDLAKLCSHNGKSSAASRAVGSAMANNPISLIVPCHRVVKADGSAGNYSKCTKNSVKIWLLRHENKLFIS
jgi:O-6-methylguanine DNA methyltransferase